MGDGLRDSEMKVALYLQLEGAEMGGGEYWLACLAHEFSRNHQVTLLHHQPALTLDRLAEFSAKDLSLVFGCDILAERPLYWLPSDIPEATLRSRDYDLFIVITHTLPPLSAARVGVLIVLFPFDPRAGYWPWSQHASLTPNVAMRRFWYRRAWRRQLACYDVKVSLSEFTRKWTSVHWSLDTTVVYPPNDVLSVRMPKNNAIISVGRFSAHGVPKGHTELIRMFTDVIEARSQDWTYSCLGSVGRDEGSQRYFAEVNAAAADHRISVEGDLTRARLKLLLAQSKIFWHPAGFSIDEKRMPNKCEHFGIVTVEAMAAGAVPVVIRRGGQPEIVRHGVDGFTCESLDEMADRTLFLMSKPELLTSMSESARARAAEFSEERSMDRLKGLVAARSGLTL